MSQIESELRRWAVTLEHTAYRERVVAAAEEIARLTKAVEWLLEVLDGKRAEKREAIIGRARALLEEIGTNRRGDRT